MVPIPECRAHGVKEHHPSSMRDVHSLEVHQIFPFRVTIKTSLHKND